MARSKSQSKTASRPQQPHAVNSSSQSAPATISARWLLMALALTVPAAVLFTWIVFCLLFWQGSWQLLYHPTSTVARTPSNNGLAYDPISFAATDTGVAQLQGWWIPASTAHYTALYLHDRTGNLGDTLNTLSDLHAAEVNVFAIDYRGYGQSQFEHPSEVHWREDATRALDYLTSTRHIDPHSIVIVGSGLGANLALEIAAAHPELAAAVLESPLDHPVDIIFNDARAKLVPARLMVRDRYDLIAPASALRVPSLWLMENPKANSGAADSVFDKVTAPKARTEQGTGRSIAEQLRSWLADLPR
jgi:pimeloyl-ACP methyl ester carboxylesterase